MPAWGWVGWNSLWSREWSRTRGGPVHVRCVKVITSLRTQHYQRHLLLLPTSVIFKEIYYCRNQIKTIPMKRGLNADFKNIKIIWGSKNFFFKNFLNIFKFNLDLEKFQNFLKIKFFDPQIIFIFLKSAFNPLFIGMLFI